jgi:hypothetical protein
MNFMFRFTRHFLALAFGLVPVLFSAEAHAFSLRGPAGPWQTEQLGYGPTPIIFGPMNSIGISVEHSNDLIMPHRIS